jgi:hypothetical protein
MWRKIQLIKLFSYKVLHLHVISSLPFRIFFSKLASNTFNLSFTFRIGTYVLQTYAKTNIFKFYTTYLNTFRETRTIWRISNGIYPAFPESFMLSFTAVNKYLNSAAFPNNLLVIFLNLMYYTWCLTLCLGLISILISSRTLKFTS